LGTTKSRVIETVPFGHYPGKDPAIVLVIIEGGQCETPRSGEIMKNQLKSGTRLICLAILITIAMLAIAGCTESVPEQQGQSITTHDQQGANPVAGTVVTTRTTTAPAPLKTTQPTAAPVSSTGVIKIDPIGDKNTGDTFTLTGTANLPAGTNIIWQILPDTGTPPTGLDGNSQMSVGGNYQVTKGDGTRNRILLTVPLGRLVPGKYVAIVGKMKGDPATGIVFEIGNDYGYTYFTLK
jgi:hypothetical protein